MMDGVTRYMAVEFCGGPVDGSRQLVRFPPAAVIDVAAMRGPVNLAAVEPAAPLQLRFHRYRRVDGPDEAEVVALSDEVLAQAKSGLATELVRDLAALCYRYEGEYG